MPYLLLPFGWPLLTGTSPGDGFGSALAGADLDGDGWIDLAVGAPGEGGAGAVHVYLGSSSGLADTPAASFSGAATGDEYGAALHAADLDGDGVDELIVGAPGAGAVEIVTGLASTGTWLAGDGAGDGFGAALSAGDVDGDGALDLVVGAPDGDAGAVWIFTEGLATSATWSGDATGDRLGAAVAADGDVDGDGDDELLVAAPGVDDGAGTTVGRASLHLGGAGGPATTATWTYEGASRPHATDVAFGDFDGDGLADLLVVPEAPYPGEEALAVFLAASGTFASAPDWGPAWDSMEPTDTVHAAPLGDLDGDGADELGETVLITDATDHGCSSPAWRSTAIVAGGAGGPSGSVETAITAPVAFAPVGDLDGNGIIDVAFGSRTDAGAVTVRLLLADADGDGWTAEWGGGLADCDDADATAFPGATETEGDGVDNDCDGGDDAPVATHTTTCPDLSTLPNAHAWSTRDALRTGTPVALADEVQAALDALAGTTVSETAARDTSGCDEWAYRWEEWETGGEGERWWEMADDIDLWSDGFDCHTRSAVSESSWVDVTLAEPTASGVVAARFHATESSSSSLSGFAGSALNGTFTYADGTRSTLSWSESGTELYDGTEHWTYGVTERASLEVDGCTTTLVYTYSAMAPSSETWELVDADHTVTVEMLGGSVCNGLAEDPDHAWATFDGVEVLVDAGTWEPVVTADPDGDGWPEPWDCDEGDPEVNPCGAEDGVDDVDENCDDDLELDGDGDGVIDSRDCAPDDPDAASLERTWPDEDGDGYGAEGSSSSSTCGDEPNRSFGNGDCDDADATIAPGAEELCDGINQDCDRLVDEGCPEAAADTAVDDADEDEDEARRSAGCTTHPTHPAWGAALLALAIARRRAYRQSPTTTNGAQ